MILKDAQAGMKERLRKAAPNRKLTLQQERHARWLRGRGLTLDEIAAYFQLSRSGVLRILGRKP